MTRNFLIAVLVGILALGVFAYFVFGLNGKPLPSPTGDSANQTATDEPSDLVIEDLSEGEGEAVESGDTVVMHYRGTLTDGTVFDSSYDRGEPFETQIGVGQVIEGWDKGVVGMKVGGKRKLTIPSEMGYGAQGAGTIPPNATLIFELELLEIK